MTNAHPSINDIRSRLMAVGQPQGTIESMTDWYAVDVKHLMDMIDGHAEDIRKLLDQIAALKRLVEHYQDTKRLDD